MQDLPGMVFLTSARLLLYGAALSLFGLELFHAWLVPRGQALPAAAARHAARLARALVVLLALAMLAWLLGETAQVGDGLPDALNLRLAQAIVVSSSFGHAWLIAAVLSTILLVANVIAPGSFALQAALSAAVLAGLACTGHAVSLEGAPGLALVGAQVLHLLAAGYWLGTLLALAAWHDVHDPVWRLAVIRFSWFGHGAVAALILSGALSTMLLLGTDAAAWNLSYVSLLGAKVLIALAMTALAIFNRYGVVPRLHARPDGSRTFIAIVKINLALGLLAVAAVSFLGLISPLLDPN
jgi:putative copper resistance protein D